VKAPRDPFLCSAMEGLANALQSDDGPSENPSGRQHQMRLRELTIRYAPLPIPLTRPAVTTPRDAALLFSILDPEPSEVVGLLLLNTKHHVLAWTEISRGGLGSAIVEPREVFRAAILGCAASIILAHNHPSGDPTPSPEDAELTRRLVASAALVGMPIADHIIVGNETGKYFSFKEAGCL
jgi:DNA repair protein RadC